jgi:hypothetical protein
MLTYQPTIHSTKIQVHLQFSVEAINRTGSEVKITIPLLHPLYELYMTRIQPVFIHCMPNCYLTEACSYVTQCVLVDGLKHRASNTSSSLCILATTVVVCQWHECICFPQNDHYKHWVEWLASNLDTDVQYSSSISITKAIHEMHINVLCICKSYISFHCFHCFALQSNMRHKLCLVTL